MPDRGGPGREDRQHAHPFQHALSPFREPATAREADQARVVGVMQAEYNREVAAVRAREEDNFKGRAEIDRLENERRRAEAARAQAEAERVRTAQEWAQRGAEEEQAAIRHNQLAQEIVEQGYQIRDIWQRGR